MALMNLKSSIQRVCSAQPRYAVNESGDTGRLDRSPALMPGDPAPLRLGMLRKHRPSGTSLHGTALQLLNIHNTLLSNRGSSSHE